MNPRSTNMPLSRYLARLVLVMVLYIITGKLGLLLAVPPGYATVIWPPSGIALGMLLVHGRNLWPGIFLGSLLLNCHISGAYTAAGALDPEKLMVAASIALGSTLQALVGRTLIARALGLPLQLNRPQQLFQLFLLAAPVSCLIAATIGIVTLHETGILPAEKIGENWLAWWTGDIFGIVVFLPLLLVAPGHKNRLTWRGTPLSALPTLSMLLLIVPLGLSFYAWKVTSEAAYHQSQAEFSALAGESEKALQHRLDSYENALLGGAGFLNSTTSISPEQWRSYVSTLHLAEKFPGINGLGWINPIAQNELPHFISEVRANGIPDFSIHPATSGVPHYIITYIEPKEKNAQAIGLNIAFETHRRQAAEQSRDTGLATITKRIVLVQDNEKQPGFLLLQPVYTPNNPIQSVAERRAALRGWVYAPFIAQHFLAELTSSQGHKFTMRIYDGTQESPEALIYQSSTQNAHSPAFKTHKLLNIMQQQWLVIWESTEAYEYEEQSDSPILVLVGGLIFTGILGLFLLVSTIRNTETIEWIVGERRFVTPLAIFVIMSGATLMLYNTLQLKEQAYIHRQTASAATEVERILAAQASDKLTALSRMAERWEVAGGTPERLWRRDSRNYIAQLKGLQQLEWLDAARTVQWAEPEQHGHRPGSPFTYAAEHAALLEQVRERNAPAVTPPIPGTPGSETFITYLPLQIASRFDGYLAATFSLHDFFAGAITKEINENYAISMSHMGTNYYKNNIEAPSNALPLSETKQIRLYDQNWELRLVPTHAFISSQKSALPLTLLASGLLIALLSALSVRYILISRLKSRYLTESNALNAAILKSAAYLIVATDEDGRIMTFNRAAEEALGYSAEEVVNIETPALWHDAQEVVERAWQLCDELNQRIEPGFEVFIVKARLNGVDSSEWSFIRRDGTRFSGNLNVSPLRNTDGKITGYLGIIEDITTRKKAESALRTSEQIFRLALESSPIGNALVAPDGRWLKVNKALCELLGYSEQELLSNDFQSITHPDDLAHDLELVNDIISGRIHHYEIEKRYYHKSGRIIWALLNVALVRHTDGSPNYFISQIQDISERREMERLKSEFISTVSHELRTPLTSIRASLGLILGAMRQEVSAKVTELLEIAHSNSERLIMLINDILDIDKIASGQMRYDMRTENLAAITHQAIESNTAYADKLNVTILCRPIPQTLEINIDAMRYIQILSNLLSNAAKFSPSGASVEVWAEPHEGKARICVKDHGAGIAEEFHSRIFGKFSQADSSLTRSKGGTGLGLHITKQMVEHMGGAVGFETELGKGTLFWVEFPIATGHSSDRGSNA